MTIKLITFDLDDTLWDTAPVIVSAEATLRQWLTEHAPNLGGVPVEHLWAIRERVLLAQPNLKHRISALRRQVLFHALEEAGYDHAQPTSWPTRVLKFSCMPGISWKSFQKSSRPWKPWPITSPLAWSPTATRRAPPGPGGLFQVRAVRRGHRHRQARRPAVPRSLAAWRSDCRHRRAYRRPPGGGHCRRTAGRAACDLVQSQRQDLGSRTRSRRRDPQPD